MWFPIRLHQVIKQAVPLVDRYTELGKLRSRSDMDREYQRLLERDGSPITFLYQGGSDATSWLEFAMADLFKL